MANLSQQKRERMLAFLETLKAQHTDDDSLIALGEIEKELKAKKYGLVWEEHEEAVDVMMQTHIPVFTEATDKEINGDPSTDRCNFLLEGDNLHALKLLEKTHHGKIDVIYIDPPYNTGHKDFKYDDQFVDEQDGFSHSKWLSFMNCRLALAKKLLSSRGVIFISIDDNEQCALKLLCDEIFGEDCFVSNICWQKVYSPKNNNAGISAEVEYILCYSKEPGWVAGKLERTEKMDSKYSNPDNDPKGRWKASDSSAPGAITHQGMVYAIQNPITGQMIYPSKGRCWSKFQIDLLDIMNSVAKYKLEDIHDEEKRAEICGTSVEEIRKGVKSIILDESLESASKKAIELYKTGVWPLFYFTNGGKGAINKKTYLSDMEGRPATNLWPYSEVGHTDSAKKELKAIFETNIPFDTPKPLMLMKRILDIASNPDSIVLDFFAGSGTLGQAVLNKNKEDNGRRRFILCTNNENDICLSVTYERIKKTISGYENTDAIPANLKFYTMDFVAKDNEDLSEALMEHIREMIQLEHGVKIDDQKYVIIMDDEDMDAFEQNIGNYTQLKAVFINQEVFLSSSQEAMLENIDIYIIPDYYFDFELREAGEIW